MRTIHVARILGLVVLTLCVGIALYLWVSERSEDIHGGSTRHSEFSAQQDLDTVEQALLANHQTTASLIVPMPLDGEELEVQAAHGERQIPGWLWTGMLPGGDERTALIDVDKAVKALQLPGSELIGEAVVVPDDNDRPSVVAQRVLWQAGKYPHLDLVTRSPDQQPVLVVADHLLVRWADAESGRRWAREHGYAVSSVPGTDWDRVQFDAETAGTVIAMERRLAKEDMVAALSMDGFVRRVSQPDDPLYPQQWALDQEDQGYEADINAAAAWSLSGTNPTGSRSILVAVIDTGIDLSHPDLTANIWINPGETAGSGIDDDGNGFIDDIHGWNFVDNNNDPSDDGFHGTHVAGTIGAEGNNGIGIAGVAHQVSLVPIRVLGTSGGYTSDIVAGLAYCRTLVPYGLRVTNNSWGGYGRWEPILEQFRLLADDGVINVFAAGNSGMNLDNSGFVTPASLAGLDDRFITVGALDHRGQPASFSNRGQAVTLFAPGVNILSTFPMIATPAMQSYGMQTAYDSLNGTSMAAPHVAGAVALLLAREGVLSPADVRQRLMERSRVLPSLAGHSLWPGTLDLHGLLSPNAPDPIDTVLVSDARILDADFDGFASPGESLVIDLELLALSSTTHSTEAYIEVLPSNQYRILRPSSPLGELPMGVPTRLENQPVVVADADITSLTQVDIALRIHAGDRHWYHTVSIPVLIPQPIHSTQTSHHLTNLVADPLRPHLVYALSYLEDETNLEAILALDLEQGAVTAIRRIQLTSPAPFSSGIGRGRATSIAPTLDGSELLVALEQDRRIIRLSLPDLQELGSYEIPVRPRTIAPVAGGTFLAVEGAGTQLFRTPTLGSLPIIDQLPWAMIFDAGDGTPVDTIGTLLLDGLWQPLANNNGVAASIDGTLHMTLTHRQKSFPFARGYFYVPKHGSQETHIKHLFRFLDYGTSGQFLDTDRRKGFITSNGHPGLQAVSLDDSLLRYSPVYPGARERGVFVHGAYGLASHHDTDYLYTMSGFHTLIPSSPVSAHGVMVTRFAKDSLHVQSRYVFPDHARPLSASQTLLPPLAQSGSGHLVAMTEKAENSHLRNKTILQIGGQALDMDRFPIIRGVRVAVSGQTLTVLDADAEDLALPGGPLQWEWDFGDGTVLSSDSFTPGHVVHNYAATGEYTIQLTVTGSSGLQFTWRELIHARNLPRVYMEPAEIQVTEGSSMAIRVNLEQPHNEDLQIPLIARAGTAVRVLDFDMPTYIVIPAGETVAEFQFVAHADGLHEETEWVLIVPSSEAADEDGVLVTILDDDELHHALVLPGSHDREHGFSRGFGSAMAMAGGTWHVGWPDQGSQGMVVRATGPGPTDQQTWVPPTELSALGRALAADGGNLFLLVELGDALSIRHLILDHGTWVEHAEVTIEGDIDREAVLAAGGGWLALGLPSRSQVHLFEYRPHLQASFIWSVPQLTGFGSALALGDSGSLLASSLAAGEVLWRDLSQMDASFLSLRRPGGGDGEGTRLFGAALALRGDTAVVGEPAIRDTEHAGRVHVFRLSGSEAFLEASFTGASESFGEALAWWGDRLLVGSPSADRVTVLEHDPMDAMSWVRSATWRDPQGGANSGFGSRLSIGESGLAIGRPGAGIGPVGDTGSVIVVDLESQGEDIQPPYLTVDIPSGIAAGQIITVQSPGDITGISGTVRDASGIHGVMVQVSGASQATISAEVTGDAWSALLPDLATGLNEVLITAEDHAGNSSSLDFTIRITGTPLPRMRFTNTTLTVLESNANSLGAMRLNTVTPTLEELRVRLAVRGTASEGLDFQPVPRVHVLPAGTAGGHTIQGLIPGIINDDLVEGDEFIILDLLPGNGYTVDPDASTLTVRIVDNDVMAYTVSAPANVYENVPFTVVLTSEGRPIRPYRVEIVMPSTLGLLDHPTEWVLTPDNYRHQFEISVLPLPDPRETLLQDRITVRVIDPTTVATTGIQTRHSSNISIHDRTPRIVSDGTILSEGEVGMVGFRLSNPPFESSLVEFGAYGNDLFAFVADTRPIYFTSDNWDEWHYRLCVASDNLFNSPGINASGGQAAIAHNPASGIKGKFSIIIRPDSISVPSPDEMDQFVSGHLSMSVREGSSSTFPLTVGTFTLGTNYGNLTATKVSGDADIISIGFDPSAHHPWPMLGSHHLWTVQAGVATEESTDQAVFRIRSSNQTAGRNVIVPALLTVHRVRSDRPHLIVDQSTLIIPGGDSRSFSVSLSEPPSDTLEVSLSWLQESEVLSIYPENLHFGADNWSQPQEVIVSAAEDDDAWRSYATLELSADGYGKWLLALVEDDPDEMEMLIPRNPVFIPHDTVVEVPIVLSARPRKVVDILVDSEDINAANDEDIEILTRWLRFEPDQWDTVQYLRFRARPDLDSTSGHRRIAVRSVHFTTRYLDLHEVDSDRGRKIQIRVSGPPITEDTIPQVISLNDGRIMPLVPGVPTTFIGLMPSLSNPFMFEIQPSSQQ